ncbi:acetyltransferase-like protein [Janthinobacterium sp. HH01]|uniref:GNAT family N-acetyltransferase n=1 Tax=Janthinobacterium sp. HH01 TaxID=1198452 RepID=UPI0002AEBF95|nr:GNAT family N-acetyltransferase [Janthinobacterium sp. HH01]ELX09551.1 acetyltransferase-like protein [Janthinobacterium sp. HH01]
MNIVVREATNDDARLIADLTRAAWAGKVNVTSSGHRETAVLVAEHLRAGGGFVLLVDEQPVGSVRWLPLDAEPDVWEVCRMGVLPQYRGSNLSQHLLEAVIHHGLSSGVEEVRLAVRGDQPKLIDFYAAFEFELAEELEYSHANPMEPPPLVMRRSLKY